jgi:branched-chain amino acid transport system permease protein
VKSRAGRSLIAVRDNETAAAVMGGNLVATKAGAFGLSAGLCALPGSVTAIRLGAVSPDIATLTILGSLTFLIIMVIGGAGSLWGPIIGAALYVFVTDRTGGWADEEAIPSVLRPFFGWSKIPPGSGIFAVILIVLMFVAPRGLVGVWKQYSPRVVRVVPRPAGVASGATSALVADTTTNSTPEGESE